MENVTDNAPFWFKVFMFFALPWMLGACGGMAIAFVTLFVKWLWNAET